MEYTENQQIQMPTSQNDSYHPEEHIKAAFHSMMHRLFNIPLDKSEFEKEKQFIFDVAEMNGYDDKFIDSVYKKHKNKNTLKQYTNLTPIHESVKRVSL